MSDFLLFSIVASIVLTVVLNLVPMIFPNSATKLKRKMMEQLEESDKTPASKKPRVQVFFPWKAMLLISVVLTVVVNLIGWMSRGG